MATDVKSKNIKNPTYYSYSDMSNVKKNYLNLLKIDNKSYKDIDIYYIGYIKIYEFGDYKNIDSVNPLYLVICCRAF